MFEEWFKQIKQKNPDVLSISVWGKDGLEVERRSFEVVDVDWDSFGPGMTEVFRKIKSLGQISEDLFLVLKYESHHTIIYDLGADCFLIIIALPILIPGKLKFSLDLVKEQLTAVI